MPDLRSRRVLVALATVVAFAAFVPVASASISPSLTLKQSTTQAGATTGTTGSTGSTGSTGTTGLTGLTGLTEIGRAHV